MRPRLLLVAVGWLLAWSASSAAQDRHPATALVRSPNTIRELFAFLNQCVAVPAGSEGSQMTLRFGLDHIGRLRGKPMVTHSRLAGDEETQRRFVAAVLRALDNCTPVPVTEEFGRIVGQQVLTWRIVVPGRRA